MNLILSSYNNQINSFNSYLHTKKSVKQIASAQNQKIYATVPSFAYKSFYCPNISFKGQVEDVNQVDESIYSDTEKFAEYFESKLQKQMGVKTEEDIQKVIDKTMELTGVDEKTVCEVVSRLTQFSDYSHLEDLENAIYNANFNYVKRLDNFNVNIPLFYLAEKKEQFMNYSDLDQELEPFIVVDNFFLDYCESLDKESNEFFYAKSCMEDSVAVDGWNKKGVSHTIFGHNQDLLVSTLATVLEMKDTGKSLDEVLNGSFIDRCKDIFGDDENCLPKIVKNEKLVEPSAKSIAEHIKPKMPTKEQIVKFVDVIEQNMNLVFLDDELSIDDKKSLICKCLDKDFEAYSTERLNVAMKNMYKKVEEKVKSLGKTMDDVVYLIPKLEKSFSLISYHYAIANDIPHSQFLEEDFSTSWYKPSKKPIENGKVYVILDDLAGSGESLASKKGYRNFVNLIFKDKNTNLILAPVYMSDNAKKHFDLRFDENERTDVDSYVCDINPSKSFIHNFFKDRHQSIDANSFLGGCGYGEVATFVMFPFCISDTNARLASLFSTYFLRYPNQRPISLKTDIALHYKNSYDDITKTLGSYNEYNKN